MATTLYQESRVTTKDATQTVLATFAIPMNYSAMVMANVTARRTGGTAGSPGDTLGYVLYAVVKNVAGVASVLSQATAFSGEDQQSWSTTWTTTGNTLQLKVAGAADNTINWLAFVNLYEVS